MNREGFDRLVEIQTEMVELLGEAKTLIRNSGNPYLYERAKAYWLAHCEIALTNNHSYLAGNSCSFEDTIKELRPCFEEEEIEEEEIEEDE